MYLFDSIITIYANFRQKSPNHWPKSHPTPKLSYSSKKKHFFDVLSEELSYTHHLALPIPFTLHHPHPSSPSPFITLTLHHPHSRPLALSPSPSLTLSHSAPLSLSHSFSLSPFVLLSVIPSDPSAHVAGLLNGASLACTYVCVLKNYLKSIHALLT